MTTPDRSWETITFKVEQELLQQLGGIPNRSEFIRNALLLALGSLCPLCNTSRCSRCTGRKPGKSITSLSPSAKA